MSICVEKRKNDVYRRGNEITIAKTGGKLGPVSWIKHYLSLAKIENNSEDYIFRAVRFYKSSKSMSSLYRKFL